MTAIKTLFGSDKDIYRSIEKVVTFGNSSEEHLKHEISEYVVTERIRDNFEKLGDALYNGMSDTSTEIGIWVSGFYGSGKSSFAKYLGFALQNEIIIDGQSFLQRLSHRINSTPIEQLFKSIIERHEPAVVLLDCATEQIKGGTLPPILELLIAKVHHLAGYSTDSQLAHFERMLQTDGNLENFVKQVSEEFNADWNHIKVNDLLRAKGIASKMAAQLYPNIWSDPRDFKSTRIDDLRSDKQKVQELLETIRNITGKENVVFIVDEVGQYVSAKNELILSLQGTLENLKDIGQGKAWFLATAQQTLTEDNPNARLNSDKLYKLNARFPIKVDIEASDIKEICTQRLLGKSTDAAKRLKGLYTNYGEKLKHFTKLENCERTMYVKTPLDEKIFVDLYPFLPHHFEIIITLLGRLAKITGGVGLRSAIKVIQDILTDDLPSEEKPLVEFSLGKLASVYHIYDVLKADIRKSYSHVVAAVDKVVNFYGEDSEHAKVAKSIGLLQLLDDLFVSPENVAVLMHAAVDAESGKEKIHKLIDEIKSMPGNTLQEIDGQLRFMTDAISKLEDEKARINPQGIEKRRVYENIIKDIFSPLPSARLLNTKAIKCGVNLNLEMRTFKLEGGNEEVQLETAFVLENEYAPTLEELRRNSTERSNGSRIYLLGKLDKSIEDEIIEIVKCEEISNRRVEDKEINDYLNSQKQQAQTLRSRVLKEIRNAFEKGEIIFRGSATPLRSLGSKLREGVQSKLKSVAEEVFDKYQQAPLNISSSDVEKLLNFPDLRTLPPGLNHFDIVKSDGRIDLSNQAIVSIQEFIDREGHVEGRKLLEYFDAAPYGWSKDTTRYLVALMFIASDIKLRIAGEDIKVKGPKAIDGLKNVNGFNKIGVSRYDGEDRPSHEMLANSVRRLAELTGETVAPLQDKIAEVVRRHFPSFQTKYSALRTELEILELPGLERTENVRDGITEVLQGEASDAAFRLGKEQSDLYDDLLWMKDVYIAFEEGAKKNFKRALDLRKAISDLPDSGIPKELKDEAQKEFDRIEEVTSDENFVQRLPELKDATANLETLISDFCHKILVAENNNIQSEIESIKDSSKWVELTPDQKEELHKTLSSLIIQDKQGMEGIKEIFKASYGVNSKIREVNDQIEEYLAKNKKPGGPKKRRVKLDLPKQVSHANELDRVIQNLEKIKSELNGNETIELDW